ncbi:MAG TPA: rhodanese-like domain-containing protein [Desulfuromonadales bacterium]|nr:rhodanese-like domain-containing protein [Desulfuromonadales bacterium]
MKRVLLALLMTMVTALFSHAASAVIDISSREAKVLLDRNKAVYLLDVRTAQEYGDGKLAGSVLIPIAELERRVAEVPKNKTILVYCAVGGRSPFAASFLKKRGIQNVYNMTDGIVGWSRNGFPVQR